VAIHEDPGPIGQGQNDARYASVPFLPTDEGLPRLVEASMAAARGTTTGIMTIAVRPAVARASSRGSDGWTPSPSTSTKASHPPLV